MNRLYDDADVVESRDRDWIAAFQKIVWRHAAQGQQLDARTLADALTYELEISRDCATALVSSVGVLAEYTMRQTDGNDALSEEEDAVSASRRAVLPLLEARLQGLIDDFESKHRGAIGPSGKPVLSEGRRPRTRSTLLGAVTMKRRWYIDPKHGGFSPAEQKIGLPDGDTTARLAEVVTMMATTVSEEMATELLNSMLGVEISKHGVQHLVHDRGQFVMSANDTNAQTHDPFDELGLMREVGRPVDASIEAPEIAYIEIDGVVPMTRDLDEARSSPVEGARGGKGLRYTLVGREVKNGVLYRGDSCVAVMPSRGSVLDKTYVSRLGHWSPFAQAIWAEMRRLRFDEAEQVVLLSDGADWIRRLAEWLPVEPLLILDLFHAKHRIWEVSRVLWGDRSPQTKRWAERQGDRVEAGLANEVIDCLERLHAKGRTHEKLDELITYFTNNLDRMDYPTYRAQGLRVTTAGVESANYHVTGARLKQQGMRWSRDGAAEMSALRADLFNGRWRTRTLEQMRAAS